MGYIADSYSGLTSFLRPLRVSPALIAQHFEQQIAGRELWVSKVVDPIAALMFTRRIPAGTLAN
jgi:hypothetical protein